MSQFVKPANIEMAIGISLKKSSPSTVGIKNKYA